MKVQCQCGTKYSFDVTPEMARNPVQLVCNQCGTDNSAAVNAIIKQLYPDAQRPTPVATVVTTAPVPMAAAVTSAPASPAPQARLRVQATAPAAEPETAGESNAPEVCRKHPPNLTCDTCRVCGKAICSQCMNIFGYVCSAYCRNEAETRGIQLPVYAGQVGVSSAQHTRKLGSVILISSAVIALLIGAYVTYLSVWSRPRVVFATPFTTAGYEAGGKIYERDTVVLHGGHLARFDWRSKQKLWGLDLIDSRQIEQDAESAVARQNEEIERLKNEGERDILPRRLSKAEFAQMLLASAQSEFKLHVHGQDIWVESKGKLTQHDWASGKASKDVPIDGRVQHSEATPEGLLVFTDTGSGEQLVKVDWNSGEAQTTQLRERTKLASLLTNRAALAKLAGNSNLIAMANALRAGTNASRPGANSTLKGYKVTQPDPMTVRLAAPAIAANALQNQRIDRELQENEELLTAFSGFADAGPQFIPDRGHAVQFSTRLLEEKTIQRQAMKAPPKKSALEGNVNQAATVAIANEIFNEMQRDRTGGIEEEDASRYEITWKRTAPETAEVRVEVEGTPSFYALATVDLLIGGRTLQVFDKSGKKLWESKLNYEVSRGFGKSHWGSELVANASAPGVERGDTLYFFDEGVLTCFDLKTGNARWRQPSVGVSKILFDDKGMLYVDTTSGSADKLKFSQQVDISDKALPVILKIDPKSGKILWRSQQAGRLSHVEGKFIYTMEWHGGDEDDEPRSGLPGLQMPPHIRLRRLAASNGKVKWEHYQKRAPLSVDFQKNTIQLVFKKELQVLKFL